MWDVQQDLGTLEGLPGVGDGYRPVPHSNTYGATSGQPWVKLPPWYNAANVELIQRYIREGYAISTIGRAFHVSRSNRFFIEAPTTDAHIDRIAVERVVQKFDTAVVLTPCERVETSYQLYRRIQKEPDLFASDVATAFGVASGTMYKLIARDVQRWSHRFDLI